MISSQNRWHGVIFAGHPDARIVPQCDPGKGNTFNQQWSVQRKGTLITQRLRTSKGAGNLRVWIANRGLSNRIERNAWVFVEAPGAFAAVRALSGGYEWRQEEKDGTGEWMACLDKESVLILEVARKEDVGSYDAVQKAVLSAELNVSGRVLSYVGLSGDKFRFHLDQSNPPAVNGEAVDYFPPKVFDSPFISSDWDSGVVTIRKGERMLTIGAEPENVAP